MDEREERLRLLYRAAAPDLDEARKRRWAAIQAIREGRGGPSVVARATGLSRSTIYAGIEELEAGWAPEAWQTRRPGGGRKPLDSDTEALSSFLLGTLLPSEKHRRWACLRWTTVLPRELARMAAAAGFPASPQVVDDRLQRMGLYGSSYKGTALELAQPPLVRDAQLTFVYQQAAKLAGEGYAVQSVSLGHRYKGGMRCVVEACHQLTLGGAHPRARGLYLLAQTEDLYFDATRREIAAECVELSRRLGVEISISYLPPARLQFDDLSDMCGLLKTAYGLPIMSATRVKVTPRRAVKPILADGIPKSWNAQFDAAAAR